MADLLTLFRALGDPTRLRIAQLISSLELSVGELVTLMSQSQPRVSRHIKILDEAGLVRRRKEGTWVFLSPGPSLELSEVRALLAAPIGNRAQFETDARQLELVRADRAKAARIWFAAHADEWDMLRALHISEAQVEQAMTDLVGHGSVDLLVDIGTGTGRMIELFAGIARRAVAVDSSPEMLRLARAKLTANGADDNGCETDFQQGDFAALPIADGLADLAIMHQVLHFAQQPEQVVAEAARILAPEGRLLIADFAPHDHEELRVSHAHARLGFADASMEDWFAKAGLKMEQGQTLEGSELTVRLWLGTKLK